jgi:hypothetical protein
MKKIFLLILLVAAVAAVIKKPQTNIPEFTDAMNEFICIEEGI